MPAQRLMSDSRRRFQSAPGLEAGRCFSRSRWSAVMIGFNPRPALRPGDAAIAEGDKHLSAVSIRARP